MNQLGEVKLSLKREFVHYHVNTGCVLKRDENFDGQKVVVTENVRVKLSEEHRQLLQNKLGVYV